MFELMILVMGTIPFVLGLVAFRRLRKDKDTGPDEPPPPPDPQPPLPILPSTPETRRTHRHMPMRTLRDPVQRNAVPAPKWGKRVPRAGS